MTTHREISPISGTVLTPHPDAMHHRLMSRAMQLATRGEGRVEPNPMVGCVIAQGDSVVGEGWHQSFGGPHAEVLALQAAGRRARGATLYVTLEPCCHHGKTPPCTEAVIAAGIHRVFMAGTDPFPAVAGKGQAQLEAAGIEVRTDVGRADVATLNAPYLRRVCDQRPWVIAKWAMTLDGKLATRTGSSQWISNPMSRQIVHQLRGRVDGILVGRATVQTDDPRLTARPPGPRVATRIVVDRQATLPLSSQLVATARDAPVLVAIGPEADRNRCQLLLAAGCHTLICRGEDYTMQWRNLLRELARRDMTNLLVEGGAQVLGSLWDTGLVDEVVAFIATKIAGGAYAPGPVAGRGVARMAESWKLQDTEIRVVDGDIYIRGRVQHPEANPKPVSPLHVS